MEYTIQKVKNSTKNPIYEGYSKQKRETNNIIFVQKPAQKNNVKETIITKKINGYTGEIKF